MIATVLALLPELLSGLLIGSVLGLTGAGGSIVAVPLLLLISDLSVVEVTGLSLGVVAISAWVGVALRFRGGEIHWPSALLFVLSGAALVIVGRRLATFIQPQLLLVAFSGLALYIALRMWQQAREAGSIMRQGRSMPASGDRLPRPQHLPKPWARLILAGCVAGFLSGLFGVGGGFFIVPVLMLISQLSVQQAIASSLVVISCLSSIGFASYLRLDPSLSMTQFALLAVGAISGMVLGSLWAKCLAGPRLQQGFAIMVVALCALSLWRAL